MILMMMSFKMTVSIIITNLLSGKKCLFIEENWLRDQNISKSIMLYFEIFLIKLDL